MNHAIPTRRHFLKLSAGAIAAPYVWTGLQAHGEAKNDKINVGSIGVSTYKNIYGRSDEFDGQGSSIGRQAAARGNMVACADVNLHHAERFAKPYGGKCQMYQDYRKLLERKDIDAVTIGTPDHWHTKIAIDAMRAGKDVYCEKPLTLTIDEGKLLTKVAKQTGAVFQVGTQQRSEHDLVFLKAAAMCRTGRLGKKLKAISSVGQPDFAVGKLNPGPFAVIAPPAELDWDFWLGQAPKVPYSKERCNFHFRWWYEYSGGQVTDWGVHHTDIAMWAMGLDHTGPTDIGGTSELPHVPGGFNVATKFDIDMRFADGQEIKLVSGPNELILFGDKGPHPCQPRRPDRQAGRRTHRQGQRGVGRGNEEDLSRQAAGQPHDELLRMHQGPLAAHLRCVQPPPHRQRLPSGQRRDPARPRGQMGPRQGRIPRRRRSQRNDEPAAT